MLLKQDQKKTDSQFEILASNESYIDNILKKNIDTSIARINANEQRIKDIEGQLIIFHKETMYIRVLLYIPLVIVNITCESYAFIKRVTQSTYNQTYKKYLKNILSRKED
jgi:hypothetical protein